MRTRGKDSAASCRSTAVTEVTFSSGGGSAQRREGGRAIILAHGCRAVRTDGEVLEARRGVYQEKQASNGRMDGGRWGKWHQTPNPMSCPCLSVGARIQHPRKRPKACRRRTSISKTPTRPWRSRSVFVAKKQLEPHSSSLQELASVAVVVGIHPALLQLLSASGNTKGNSGSACRARIRLPCVIVIPVSISTAGLCLSRRQWYGILTRDPTRSFSLRLFSDETKPVLVQFPSYSQLYTLAAPRQTCTQCNECELTVLLPLLRCMFCVPFAVADAS